MLLSHILDHVFYIQHETKPEILDNIHRAYYTGDFMVLAKHRKYAQDPDSSLIDKVIDKDNSIIVDNNFVSIEEASTEWSKELGQELGLDKKKKKKH